MVRVPGKPELPERRADGSMATVVTAAEGRIRAKMVATAAMQDCLATAAAAVRGATVTAL
jgi:hypothetical protein